MKELKQLHLIFLVFAVGESVFNLVAVASRGHQKSKFCAVVGAEGF